MIKHFRIESEEQSSVITIKFNILAPGKAGIETGIRLDGSSGKQSGPLPLFVIVLSQFVLDAEARTEFCLALVTEYWQKTYCH